MGLFPLLKGIVEELDPDGVVIPSMVGGFTDGRMFARLRDPELRIFANETAGWHAFQRDRPCG